MYDKKAEQIFDEMIKSGLIPDKGEFEITDFLLERSFEIGQKLFSSENKKRRPSDKRFHKKLAGINLLHLNNERIETEVLIQKSKSKLKQRSGILYLIENKSFPNFIKIGITKDLNARLSTYQTYDPYRSFKVKKYVFIQDVRIIEKYLLDNYNISDINTGEWVSIQNIKDIENFMNKF